MRIAEKFSASAKEFKKLRTIVVCAMLIALYFIIDSYSISMGSLLRIGFSFITVAMAGMLFGPVASMVCAALGDVLTALLIPRGAYFPGFTLTAIVGGLIYGLMLYGETANLWRALFTKGLVNLFANILLNTLWLSMLYGDSFVAIVGMRIIKNACALVPEALILFLVTALVKTILKRTGNRPNKT